MNHDAQQLTSIINKKSKLTNQPAYILLIIKPKNL